ncbi:MAG: hypothetical protein MSS56_03105 [Spirochaetia bacterium]|nr:hypothetical protein [Spirochaetia bacterium]
MLFSIALILSSGMCAAGLLYAVLAILVTPPLGAFAIEATYRKFLERE